jgi:hypothetical protein
MFGIRPVNDILRRAVQRKCHPGLRKMCGPTYSAFVPRQSRIRRSVNSMHAPTRNENGLYNPIPRPKPNSFLERSSLFR